MRHVLTAVPGIFTVMTEAVIFLALFCLAVTGQYCQRGSIVLDTKAQCLLSSNFDLENCCQVCPVLNATGYYQFCLSVYDLGFPTCGAPGSLEARQSACSALGGNINAGTFMCLLSGGSNKSQSTGWVPTGPTSTIGSPLLTTAPTSNASAATFCMALYTVLTVFYVFIGRD